MSLAYAICDTASKIEADQISAAARTPTSWQHSFDLIHWRAEDTKETGSGNESTGFY